MWDIAYRFTIVTGYKIILVEITFKPSEIKFKPFSFEIKVAKFDKCICLVWKLGLWRKNLYYKYSLNELDVSRNNPSMIP